MRGCGLFEDEDREALELSVYPKWTPEALTNADSICLEFIREFGPQLSSLEDDGCASRAGHDLWLTRNGHGAGFWDGDWPEPFAAKATSWCKAWGEANVWFDAEAEILHLEE